jgi:ABC-type polysaccharide/polyol phosphate export permease
MTANPQVFEYDSAARRSPAWSELQALLQYRDLLALMVANQVKMRYKRSALGVVWTLLQPLLYMAVFAIAFSTLFRSALPHYAVFVLTGLVAWNFFTQSTVFAMNSLVWGGSLLKRVYMPRTIFAVSAIGHGLVNLGLALLPLLLLILVVGHPLYITWLFVPVAVLLLAMFALGMALLLSAVAVFFVDVVDLYQTLILAWFFLTAVMYPVSILPKEYAWYINLNPMYNLLELFRAPIYLGQLPGPHTMLAAVVSAVAALGLGWWLFTRKADQFAYRL